MSINRLIALGGRGVQSPVQRYMETKGQMERGRLRNVQEQAGYQNIDINRQKSEQAARQERINQIAPLAKAVLSAGPSERPMVYEQAKQQLTTMGIDMSQAPQVPDETALKAVMEAGGLSLDETFTETYKDGQPVSQKSSKSGRVYAHPEAPTKAEEGGPGAFSGKISPISDTERRNMSKEFEISKLMDNLESKYKDEYSGFLSTNVGEMALAAGRRGFAYEEMADYMTEYQEWKNLVRHSLFGSQLTKAEMSEFEKTTINPAWTAKRNRKILARQKELLNRGKKRAIVTMKAKGWTDDLINEFEGTYETGDDGNDGEMPDDEYQQRLNQILNP